MTITGPTAQTVVTAAAGEIDTAATVTGTSVTAVTAVAGETGITIG